MAISPETTRAGAAGVAVGVAVAVVVGLAVGVAVGTGVSVAGSGVAVGVATAAVAVGAARVAVGAAWVSVAPGVARLTGFGSVVDSGVADDSGDRAQLASNTATSIKAITRIMFYISSAW